MPVTFGTPAASIAALNDPHPEFRAEAIDALKDIGRAATVAIPAITAALNDSDEHVRDEAEEALERFKTLPAIE